MEIKSYVCDICGLKAQDRNRFGALSLNGGRGGNACYSINYKDVCYHCTERLFKFISQLNPQINRKE